MAKRPAYASIHYTYSYIRSDSNRRLKLDYYRLVVGKGLCFMTLTHTDASDGSEEIVWYGLVEGGIRRAYQNFNCIYRRLANNADGEDAVVWTLDNESTTREILLPDVADMIADVVANTYKPSFDFYSARPIVDALAP